MTTDTTTNGVADRSASAQRAGVASHTEGAVGLLLIRLVLGVVFAAHGSQKLFGWFGGGGLDGTAAFFASVGYEPSKTLAVLAAVTEFGGGLLLIVGLGTSIAAAGLAVTMAGATAATAQFGGGFFAGNGGFELELTLAIAALGLTLTGAGPLSLDRGRSWDIRTVRVGAAAAAVVGAILAVLVR